MARKTKKQLKLEALEKEIKQRGVNLAYERLSYAGLRLKSGLCWFKGSYYLFVDRLLPVQSRIDLLSGALDELEELAAQGRLENPEAETETQTAGSSDGEAAP